MKSSSSKHWCTLCRCFIQNDLKSIRFHEEGLRHLGAVKRKLTKAARLKDAIATKALPIEDEEKPEVNLQADEILGQYTVRGITYLQGNYHEDLLLLRSSFEYQVALTDDEGEPAGWADCEILGFNGAEKVYEVKYTWNNETDQAFVPPTDIRILGPSPPSGNSEWRTIEPNGGLIAANQEEEEAEDKIETHKTEYYKGVVISEEMIPIELPIPQQEHSHRPSNTLFRKRAKPGKLG